MPLIWNLKTPIQPMHKTDMMEDQTKDVHPTNDIHAISCKIREIACFYDLITFFKTRYYVPAMEGKDLWGTLTSLLMTAG